MLPSETMIWQPEFTDKTLSRKPGAVQSLSALLKQYGIRLTANQAYHQMVKLGIVEQRERYSRTAINNIKKFWSLTAKGCMFGKNITSPANPRETQPHFFESRFPELLKLLDTVH
ncbi:TPA: hypothetical protein IRB07_001436 [Escherichia coli]|nr:hypothetical protein [Escherichia coli]